MAINSKIPPKRQKRKMKSETNKRARRDSAKTAVDVFQNATRPTIKPPKHVTLRPGDLPFWNDVIRARARETWTDFDLSVAANLARCLADIEKVQKKLSGKDLVVSPRGAMVENPLHRILETLTRRQIVLARNIHVHSAATTGDSRKAKDAAQAEHTARRAAAAMEDDIDDGLIPTQRDMH